MSMAFSSSMKIFLSCVPGMHVVVFTRSSSVARALASTPICCYSSILQYTKRTKPSADTWAIDPRGGACGAFFSLRFLVSKCMRTSRWWCVSCGNMKSNCDIYCRYRMPLLGAFSCRPTVACLRNHLLRACRYWCGCHPQDTAVETELIFRARVYEQSCMVSLWQLLWNRKRQL